MVDPRPRRRREMPAQDRGQPPDRFGSGAPSRVDRWSQAVGHPPRANRDPPLARALAIAIGIGEIAQNFRPCQPIWSQTSGGSGSVTICAELSGSHSRRAPAGRR
jgi:hypothetical protein